MLLPFSQPLPVSRAQASGELHGLEPGRGPRHPRGGVWLRRGELIRVGRVVRAERTKGSGSVHINIRMGLETSILLTKALQAERLAQ